MKRFTVLAAACMAATLACAAPKAAAPSKLTGTFFQPWFVEGWKSADWARLFDELRAAGVDDHVIWQWTADSLNKVTWYPTKLEGYAMVENTAVPDPVGESLALAKKAGLTVWLGLNWTDDWWNRYANDPEWLENEFAVGRAVAAELWNRYGADYADVIAGFYLTMEVDNDNFAEAGPRSRMASVYGKTVDFIHKTANKPVMIAPFCSDSGAMDPKAWGAMWKEILKTAAIDVVNMQDGCGASDDGRTTHTTVETVGSWFAAMKGAVDAARPSCRLWSDLETFDMDADGNCFPCRDFARIARQMAAEAPYVERFSSFAVMHYQTAAADESYAEAARAQYGLLKARQAGTR